ncbi:MAG TPA: hypothetical protein GX715_07840 [Armatimonadetes bacterium]|nr:hypothetical protein [Armatimonadota bacterium]
MLVLLSREGVTTFLNCLQVQRIGRWVFMALAWCFAASGAYAEAKPVPPQPQLLVLVSTGRNGVDQVAISYEGEVSEAKARAELRALLKATGWKASDVMVDCQALSPGAARMTSVSFAAPVVVPYPEGTLPVAEFVQAYKAYRHLVLVFQLSRPFRLTGPDSYEDQHVSIRLQQGTGIHRYDVRVTDPSFNTLELPELPRAETKTPDEPSRSGPSLALVVLLALGMAVSVGAVVYLFLTSRGATSAARREKTGATARRKGAEKRER